MSLIAGVLPKDASGRVITRTTGALNQFNGGTPVADNGTLFVGAFAGGNNRLGGLRYTDIGALTIDNTNPAIAAYVAGFPVDVAGNLLTEHGGTIDHYTAGLPVNALGQLVTVAPA